MRRQVVGVAAGFGGLRSGIGLAAAVIRSAIGRHGGRPLLPGSLAGPCRLLLRGGRPPCRPCPEFEPIPTRAAAVAIGLTLSLLVACSPEAPPAGESGRVPVETAEVVRGEFQPMLSLLGTVRPAASVEVVSQVGGRISYPSRFASGLATGARVEKGEHLATLAHPQVELALDEAELNSASAEAELARYRRAVEEGVEAEAVLVEWETRAALARERLEAAREETGWVRITAPAAGSLVVDRVRPAGSELGAGTLLATVAAEGRPRVEAWAAAADRRQLSPGLEAVLRRGNEVVGEAIVKEVASVVDAAGTVRVLAKWVGEGPYLLPGEGVELEVRLDRRLEVLTIPEEALTISAGGSAVFVIEPGREGARVRREPVTVAGRGEGRVEVSDGVDEGERVVVSGVSLLSDWDEVMEIRIYRDDDRDDPEVVSEADEADEE